MNTFFKFLLVLSLVTLFSCGSDNQGNDDDFNSGPESLPLNESQKASAQNIFNAVPSPQEFTDLINRARLEYDGMILNNPDNYKRYSSDDLKALNLGVYGTDLTYASVFEQTQESMLFLKCVNQACKSLGISGVFDDKIFDRLEANKQNKDSLLIIISKSFWSADKFLRENQRSGTSSLMVAGGWIEGMFLALNAAKTSKDKKIIQKIAEQKNPLKEVIVLLESDRLNPQFAYLVEDLKKLSQEFEHCPSFSNPQKEGLDAELDTFVNTLDTKLVALRNKITLNRA